VINGNLSELKHGGSSGLYSSSILNFVTAELSAQEIEAVWGNIRNAPNILNIGTR